MKVNYSERANCCSLFWKIWKLAKLSSIQVLLLYVNKHIIPNLIHLNLYVGFKFLHDIYIIKRILWFL